MGLHLRGQGIELGPGHSPFAPLPPDATVRYVDRWQPEENAALFAELGDASQFPVPDVVANLDTDRLGAFADGSEDFVICSHVLEHMADPIGLLCDVHRVLRPGGTVLILLPDRHRTFDRAREPTPLAHLVADHAAGVTEVDDAHVEEFLTNAYEDPAVRHHIPNDAEERRALFAHHRQRSIHAHCWDQDEFVPVLAYGIAQLDHCWELLDGVMTPEAGPGGIEFGFVLRRSPEALPAAARLARFDAQWLAWKRARMLWLHVDVARPPLTGLEVQLASEVESLNAQLAAARAAQAELAALRRTKTFRYTARLRTGVALLRAGLARRRP